MYRTQELRSPNDKEATDTLESLSTVCVATDFPKFPTRRPRVSQGSDATSDTEAASAVQLKLDDLLLIQTGLQGPCFPP